jgi:DnaJ like chaperone protein
MAKFGKWIGGGLGWVMGGPIGGLLGFLVGSMVDSVTVQTSEVTSGYRRTAPGNFMISLLDYVRQFFVRQFGRDSAREATIMLRDLLKQDIPLLDVCHQIGRNMDYSSRLQLIHLLFYISLADGTIHPSEQEIINRIADYTGITSADFMSIRNMFLPETDSFYKILEVDPSATNDEVKKAYRRMAMKYHPDKVSQLGEDFKKTADEKFMKVNEAYERIKKERNIA